MGSTSRSRDDLPNRRGAARPGPLEGDTMKVQLSKPRCDRCENLKAGEFSVGAWRNSKAARRYTVNKMMFLCDTCIQEIAVDFTVWLKGWLNEANTPEPAKSTIERDQHCEIIPASDLGADDY